MQLSNAAIEYISFDCKMSVAYKSAEFLVMYVMLGGMASGKIFDENV
jgi:hypothetical protein